jgi:hypothetical protein
MTKWSEYKYLLNKPSFLAGIESFDFDESHRPFMRLTMLLERLGLIR